MRLILIMLLLSILTTGCNKAYFQPPPPEYEIWSKSGASELDVKKAMLECGMNNPFGETDPKLYPYNRNRYYLARFCMESEGYIERGMNVREACRLYPETPACQPDAVIPKPSVERRLNSKYCQHAKSMIDPAEFKQCLVEAANPRDSATPEDCVYWFKELRAECRP
ncbi:MAG: hypothetical protein COB41_10230 [Proteobacteria bacterium]|nr:MAG: hypothetical protein COB41_10230 [Pseudomonadota bacterium]